MSGGDLSHAPMVHLTGQRFNLRPETPLSSSSAATNAHVFISVTSHSLREDQALIGGDLFASES